MDALLGMNEHEEDDDTNYVSDTDNYFILCKAVGKSGLGWKGVGCVGAIRFCKG